MKPWSELPIYARGSAPHSAHCRKTLRGCCPGRRWRVVLRLRAKGDDSVAAARGDCVVQMSMRASCALHESSSLDFLRCVSCFVSASPPCVVFENDVPFVLDEPWAPSFTKAHTLGAGLQISRALTGRGWPAVHVCTVPIFALDQKTTHDNKFVSDCVWPMMTCHGVRLRWALFQFQTNVWGRRASSMVSLRAPRRPLRR